MSPCSQPWDGFNRLNHGFVLSSLSYLAAAVGDKSENCGWGEGQSRSLLPPAMLPPQGSPRPPIPTTGTGSWLRPGQAPSSPRAPQRAPSVPPIQTCLSSWGLREQRPHAGCVKRADIYCLSSGGQKAKVWAGPALRRLWGKSSCLPQLPVTPVPAIPLCLYVFTWQPPSSKDTCHWRRDPWPHGN